jgi:hypothetical protein
MYDFVKYHSSLHVSSLRKEDVAQRHIVSGYCNVNVCGHARYAVLVHRCSALRLESGGLHQLVCSLQLFLDIGFAFAVVCAQPRRVARGFGFCVCRFLFRKGDEFQDAVPSSINNGIT